MFNKFWLTCVFATSQLVIEAADQIRNMDPALEHGALIVNGQALAIVTGTEVAIPGVLFFIEPMTKNIDLSGLNGLIHSHPQSGDVELDRLNWWSSDSDLRFVKNLCNIAREYGGDPQAMTSYILGPDGNLRSESVNCDSN